MTLKEIEEKVRTFLIDELEIDADRIHGDALLNKDLGIDSLEIVDIMVLVEQEFGLKLKMEDFKTIRTFDDFCTTIEERIG